MLIRNSSVQSKGARLSILGTKQEFAHLEERGKAVGRNRNIADFSAVCDLWLESCYAGGNSTSSYPPSQVGIKYIFDCNQLFLNSTSES